jgi:hypothetical protein
LRQDVAFIPQNGSYGLHTSFSWSRIHHTKLPFCGTQAYLCQHFAAQEGTGDPTTRKVQDEKAQQA